MYNITVRRITTGELLRQQSGFFFRRGYGAGRDNSSQVALTMRLGSINSEEIGALADRLFEDKSNWTHISDGHKASG